MNAQTKIEPAGLAKLREPFPEHQISKLPKPLAKREVMDTIPKAKCKVCGNYHATDKIIHLDYVGHAALTDRLLDTDPEWTWEPMGYTPEGLPALDRNGGLWIKLTVLGMTRPGYGCADGKNGGDAMKEIIGDALRNAAMRFGAALDLWHKGDLHVDEGGEDSGGDNAPTGMPDAEWAKLASLIQSTNADTTAMLKRYGVKDLRHLNQDQYGEALKVLNAKLAKLAKEETNAKAKEQSAPPAGEFAEVLEDQIPY